MVPERGGGARKLVRLAVNLGEDPADLLLRMLIQQGPNRSLQFLQLAGQRGSV